MRELIPVMGPVSDNPDECCRCATSTARQYTDVLGHDRLGHHAHNVLAAAGFVYSIEVAQASDKELLEVRGLGRNVLERIRERIPRAGIDPEQYSPAALVSRLPRGLQLESWMYTEPDRAAALWLLTAFADDDKRVWPHVHSRSVDFTAMSKQRWQPSERLVLRAARSLYSVKGNINLSVAAAHMTELQWRSLLEAMRIRRGHGRSAT